MGGDSDLEGRMETVAHRVEFIELLEAEEALQPRDIVDALPHSRPTVTRALRELREAALVEKREDSYTPTLAGVMAADEYRRYEVASNAILSAGDLLEPIPKAHAPPVELLIDADTTRAEAGVPIRVLEAVSDRVQQAETVRAYLPTLVNTHLLRVWHRAVVATAVDSQSIFDPDLLTVLKGQYPHLLAEMAATDGFAAFSTTGPPYGVVLTSSGDTTSVAVIVYENDTAVRGVLTNDSPAAVEWARTKLDRLRADAVEVTADLNALSTAIADGVAQSPSLDSGSGPSHPAGDVSGQVTAGHALPIDLDAEGFVRLSEEYFDAHGRASPEVSWRTGFTLAEVHAGHAVDRRDAEGRNLTQHLIENVRAGTDRVVLGPPGSGKSTVCMAVACEWYDRGLGPVLYRERGNGDRFESTALLEAYLRETDGHALVVVEDAVRDEANATFEVMQTLDADPSVTWLLDARTHGWRNPDRFDVDARRDAYRRTAVDSITVPDMDEHECKRFVDHFSDLVNAELDLSGAELFAMVEEGTTTADEAGLPAGDALVAQHYLARRYDPPVDVDASAATALDEAVYHTYQSLTAAEARLAPDLAVLIVLFTAAGIPVAKEYLYAVAPADEYAAVDEAIPLLKGRLLFEQDQQGVRSPTIYRTRHETWAMRFLEQFRAIEPTHRARERVGQCVTQLLALADESARRTQIERHLGGRTPHLHRIEADPQGWADELVERIFRIGQTNASLAPLFGETTDDGIELPEACSAWMRLQQAYWRGEMNRTHGDLARAEREYHTLGQLAEQVELLDEPDAEPATPAFTSSHAVSDDDVAVHRTRWRATSRTNLGMVAQDRGENETAKEYHQEALELFREIDDPVGEAISLKNLGAVAFYQSDYDQAREYYQRSLELAVENDARRIEVDNLSNLAGIAWKQGGYDQAREYLQRALTIGRDLGDKQAEFSILNNLGEIAQAQGAYDQARGYYEQSLAIFRELGDRQSEATILNNLGLVAERQGAYDQARKYFKQSLTLKRELGNRQGEAKSLHNLGEVARYQGAYDQAREYFERSLTMNRNLGDRQGEATSLNNLGVIAYHQGDYDEATEYVERSLEIARDINARAIEARCLNNLAMVAQNQDEYERGREYLTQARETFEAVGSEFGIARSLLMIGRLTLAQDNIDMAREHTQEARETFDELGTSHWEGRSRHLLGQVAAAANAPNKAREHWRAALDIFETVNTPQDALATLKELVETCREQGDDKRAGEWCQRAQDVVADAPDSTATQHCDWIERYAAEFEGE